MNIKGGYKLIDFKDVNIVADTPTTITGVYNAIENNYRKPLLITGLTIDGVEKEDTFINFEHSENLFNGLLGMIANNEILFISVTNEDSITISKHTLTLA